VSALLVDRWVIGDGREESAFSIGVKLEKSAGEMFVMYYKEYGKGAEREF
jgi:hypothetical protein